MSNNDIRRLMLDIKNYEEDMKKSDKEVDDLPWHEEHYQVPPHALHITGLEGGARRAFATPLRRGSGGGCSALSARARVPWSCS